MYRNLFASLAVAVTNAIKLAQTDYDCLSFSATDTAIAFEGPRSVTVSWTAPVTTKSEVASYRVSILDNEFDCDVSPCTLDVSALNIAADAGISAVVKPVWATPFTVPFPLVASAEAVPCVGTEAAQALADAINAKDSAAALASLAIGCPIDQTRAPLFQGFEKTTSALHAAIWFEMPEVAIELIKQGADVDERNPGHWTFNPLSYTCHPDVTENLDVVHALLAAGADPNQAETVGGKFTAMHVCAKNGKTDTLDVLIEEGADINIENKDGSTPLKVA
jgi:hypothetical protein